MFKLTLEITGLTLPEAMLSDLLGTIRDGGDGLTVGWTLESQTDSFGDSKVYEKGEFTLF